MDVVLFFHSSSPPGISLSDGSVSPWLSGSLIISFVTWHMWLRAKQSIESSCQKSQCFLKPSWLIQFLGVAENGSPDPPGSSGSPEWENVSRTLLLLLWILLLCPTWMKEVWSQKFIMCPALDWSWSLIPPRQPPPKRLSSHVVSTNRGNRPAWRQQTGCFLKELRRPHYTVSNTRLFRGLGNMETMRGKGRREKGAG